MSDLRGWTITAALFGCLAFAVWGAYHGARTLWRRASIDPRPVRLSCVFGNEVLTFDGATHVGWEASRLAFIASDGRVTTLHGVTQCMAREMEPSRPPRETARR